MRCSNSAKAAARASHRRARLPPKAITKNHHEKQHEEFVKIKQQCFSAEAARLARLLQLHSPGQICLVKPLGHVRECLDRSVIDWKGLDLSFCCESFRACEWESRSIGRVLVSDSADDSPWLHSSAEFLSSICVVLSIDRKGLDLSFG